MKKATLLLAGACVLSVRAHGQNLDDPLTQRHHFGVEVPTWIKARAKFTATRATNPGAAPGAPPTLADGRVDRVYDDGFNRVSSTGNSVPPGDTEPRTSFFSYASDAQVGVPGGTTLAMHSAQLNGGDYTRALDNQPFPGLEFTYRYDWKAGKHWLLGWELAAGYNYWCWQQHGAPNSTVDLITDVFNLSGVVLANPGGAPYTGLFTQTPGASLLGSTPARTDATVAAGVTGTRKLEMHSLQLRVAPALDWMPNDKWSVGVQGGLALGVGFSSLNFAEQITVAAPNIAPINQSGSSSDAHFWAGLLSAVRVTRHLNEHWDMHIEVRHLLTDTIHHTGPTRSGEINFSDGFGLSAGLSRAF